MSNTEKPDEIKKIQFDPKLTQSELDEIQFALDNLNDDHENAVDKILFSETEEDIERLKKEVVERFANEFGAHEAADRAWLAMEHWDEYIRHHPLVVMDEKAFRLASIATALMAEVYQIMGCKYWEDE